MQEFLFSSRALREGEEKRKGENTKYITPKGVCDIYSVWVFWNFSLLFSEEKFSLEKKFPK